MQNVLSDARLFGEDIYVMIADFSSALINVHTGSFIHEK